MHILKLAMRFVTDFHKMLLQNYFENRVLLKSVVEVVASVAYFSTGREQTQVGWGWTLVCFLAHRGSTGGLLLLQCFNVVADPQGISRCLNVL